MKKRILYLVLLCIIGFIVLFAGSKSTGSPIIQMKTLALSQRLIPVFYLNPKDRIIRYIQNADDLFALSKILLVQNHTLALECAFRAENSMTLMVAPLRGLQDTSIIPHELIFDAFIRQYSFINEVPKDSADIQQFEIIKTFMQRNEKMAKMIYFNGLPPDISIKL
jgi:hypothetical protein